MKNTIRNMFRWIAVSLLFSAAACADDNKAVRVFIFAGQSNMVGSDSKVKDINRFPPFAGLENAQTGVKFSFCIGRENKMKSEGWVDLQPVNNIVGPELSFARKVAQNIDAPVAIIKCAAGGTHLGGDWNPDQPEGFKMYPLALDLVKSSLAELDRQEIAYRIEGFMWHQGENDMFNKEYMSNYGENLKNFLARWRRDLKTPTLKFYIGELCTKTIWGMDLRPRMYAISRGQRAVTGTDARAEYIPTSHIGVEIGGGVGLHYHYGTLGQLEHGVNYADAYLKTIGKKVNHPRPLKAWPYQKGSRVKLFILAGHRNMEGERAFVQELETLKGGESLRDDTATIAYKYSIGGGYRTSDAWEPLGPAGAYDNFGPELSFGRTLQNKTSDRIAIAKFTHSGTQIIDWTPEGSVAESRHIYPHFIAFVKEAIRELEDKDHQVELAGIFYHLGENDMSFGPHRKNAAKWLRSTVMQSRKDLRRPTLKWYVSQQPPTDDKRVNSIDVTSEIERVATADRHLIHIKAFDLPREERKLVITTAGIVQLGKLIATSYLEHEKQGENKN
ncbi:MAG TPA: sialate O-acetylesterase [Pirellulaceae bacterium]|nr:sialate O-acetylesterase [Pirellulaceae bacterium]